jgi:hypothetical protein
MTFKLKLLLAFILYGLSLVLLTQFVVFKVYEKNIKLLSINNSNFAKESTRDCVATVNGVVS